MKRIAFDPRKQIRNLIAAAAMCAAFDVMAADSSASSEVPNQQSRRFERKITRTVEADYLLFLPKDYKQRGSKRWPLILFLHGAGERGTNVSLVAVHGPPKIVQKDQDFQFIVVSPQCPAGRSWSNDTVLGLLDEITKKYKVDEKRIYLTGLSMGGFGTWSLGSAFPEKFAAIAPICGGGDPIGVWLSEGAIRDKLRALPVWAFHGAKDNVVPLSESEKMVNAFKDIGNQAKLTVYPEAGHDSWTETYENPELYKWFLQHKKPTK